MIEKMCFINLTGFLEDIDYVTENYILKFDIKLEYSPDIIGSKYKNKDVKSFDFPNPYDALVKKSEQAKIVDQGDESKNYLSDSKTATEEKIVKLRDNFEIKKFCAVVRDRFFIFAGWIPKRIFESLKDKSKDDTRIIVTLEDSDEKSPPVVLKNNFIFKPFENLVKMYGVPSYNEIDPTPFLAITYTVLFGLMFGDVGQGFVLFLMGLFLKKRGALFKIISMLGVSSIIFGFLYGSVFGFESLIPTLWFKPSNDIMFILAFTVGAGIFLISLSMIFNLINCKKNNDVLSLLLGSNGLSGFAFYIFILLGFLFLFWGQNSKLFFVLALVNLFFVAFSEPIKKLARREKNVFGSNIFLFLFETVIELFETLLSYFTNTVSFVRVGAFALSHAGMMGVVMLLSKTEAGSYNWPVVILGNLLVIGLEGLIVGIQALRLEFYEMFGRFFRGTGREYVSNKKS